MNVLFFCSCIRYLLVPNYLLCPQANERSLQMTASELKASNDRLKAMLMDQKNAFRYENTCARGAPLFAHLYGWCCLFLILSRIFLMLTSFLIHFRRDLDVSEATYEELRHANESDLSLREFVCLQVYGQRLQLKQDLEESRRDVEAAAEAKQQAGHASETRKRDLQRAAVASAQREEGLRLELESAKR